MKCYYHNDLDGKCAAHLLYEYVLPLCIHEELGNMLTLIPMDYTTPILFDIIKKNEDVFIVDFSFSLAQMGILKGITKNIVWIDHHKSAIEKFAGTEYENLRGLRRIGSAGCELTYEYFFGADAPKPEYVKLIGRYDVWDLDYPSVREFKLGMDSFNTDPKYGIWSWVKEDWAQVADKGLSILEYIEQSNKEYLDSLGFEVELDGYKCLACNKKSNSWLFGDKIKEYDIVIPFVLKGDTWTLSLYTERDDIDCSKIAAAHGGGGHKQAAGFSTKTLPWLLL